MSTSGRSDSTHPGDQDLDTTAELPMLDVAAYEASAAQEHFTATDTWVVQSPAVLPQRDLAEPVSTAEFPEIPATAGRDGLEPHSPPQSSRASELEAELASRNLAFKQVEGELLEARIARVRAERRAEELAAQLSAAREEARALAQCNGRYLESIQTADSRCGVFEGLLDEYEEEIRKAQGRIAALEQTSAQHGTYESRLAEAHARASSLARDVEDGARTLGTAQVQLQESHARRAELENDLRVAEEAINRLEAELRGKNTRLEEFAKARPREPYIPAPPQDPAPEGAVRLLIRSEGDSEVVHVLGRRTSIGRTPDNDVEIDAKYVSRHHAVVLAGPTYTVIEDLNSTNGVMVNNRRITRHTLKDGDMVAIGRSQFRFVVRGANRVN